MYCAVVDDVTMIEIPPGRATGGNMTADGRQDALGSEMNDLIDAARQQLGQASPCTPANHQAIARGMVIIGRVSTDTREFLRDELPCKIREIVREELTQARGAVGRVSGVAVGGGAGAGVGGVVCWILWQAARAKGWLP